MKENRKSRRQDDDFTQEGDDFIEQLIQINRVMRVRKGGRKQSFNALAVVGNQKGTVGVGFGKANEVPEAIRKSLEDARKNLIEIPLYRGTIPHGIIGKAGTSRVILKPASPGTGIVAGGATRLILEAAGVQDVLSKTLGSRNKINTAAATMDGLARLRDATTLARLRGKEIHELFA